MQVERRRKNALANDERWDPALILIWEQWTLTWYNAKMVKTASTEPAAPKRWPVAPLVEDTFTVSQWPSNTRLMARFSATSPFVVVITTCSRKHPRIQILTNRRAGSMCVNVTNLRRGQLGSCQRSLHRKCRACSVFWRGCHVVRISR